MISNKTVILSFLKRERERTTTVSELFLFIKKSQTVENADANGQERWKVVTLNDQERLGTNRGKRSLSRFKNERITLLNSAFSVREAF